MPEYGDCDECGPNVPLDAEGYCQICKRFVCELDDDVDYTDPSTFPANWAPGWGFNRPKRWNADVYLFQQRHGLREDGLLGPATIAKGFLLEELRKIDPRVELVFLVHDAVDVGCDEQHTKAVHARLREIMELTDG